MKKQRSAVRSSTPVEAGEDFFRKIYESSNDMIFLMDPGSDHIIDANPKACEKLQYGYHELLSTPISAIHPHELSALKAFAERVLRDGYGWTNELSCMTRSGSLVPSEISASAIKIGGKARILALIRDITERKEAERALRDSEERLFRILESAMDAIITLDDRKNVLLMNSAANDIFRCKDHEWTGKPIDSLLAPDFLGLLEDYTRSSRTNSRQKPLWAPDLTAIRSTGEEFPAEATLSEFEMRGRKHFTIILRDVNERKKAEEEQKKLRLENLYLKEEIRLTHSFEDIIGSSKALKKVLKQVEQVASTDATVLILGETGTGKELFARAIHGLSPRKDRPLIKVNCAALPPTLIESELFGHEKGSFTGAFHQKTGRFELAHLGTIFLDEIGDLPPELQVKLLRVLQEGEFERIGGAQTISVNVRVIAATNRNLKEALRNGKFREDLYYRLDVFPITLPPLSERKEDIRMLVKHFVKRVGNRMGKHIEVVPDDLFPALEQYSWPGNIRELENLVERAVILSPGPELHMEEFLPERSAPPPDTGRTLQEVERDYILRNLEKSNWVIEGKNGAAHQLGLSPSTLRDRMRKHGLKRP